MRDEPTNLKTLLIEWSILKYIHGGLYIFDANEVAMAMAIANQVPMEILPFECHQRIAQTLPGGEQFPTGYAFLTPRQNEPPHADNGTRHRSETGNRNALRGRADTAN